MNPEEYIENHRLMIAIALVATFLTLLFSLDKFIPNNSSKVLLIIKGVVYAHFAFICFMFFLYLLFKGRNLKYKKDNTDFKANDISVCLQFILLWVFKRKSIKYNREYLRNLFNNNTKENYKFYYDEGIRQSFFFPFSFGLYLLIYYVSQLVDKFLNLNTAYINLIAIGIIFLFYLSASLILNLFRFLITGEQ